jgi:hypothetical protein
MTENERFDKILDRIERAKKKPSFVSWPEFMLRVKNAERILGLGHLPAAEYEIEKAENALLRREILAMAQGLEPNIFWRVVKLVESRKYDEALEILLA